MQPSVYLHHAEYGVYGLDDAAAEDVIQASSLMDGFMNRPEGLFYSDADSVMTKTDQPIEETVPVPLRRAIMLTRFPVVRVLSVSYWNGQAIVDVPLTGGQVVDQLYYPPPLLPSRIRATIRYIAGYPGYQSLPVQIRSTCASVIKAVKANCDMSGNIKFQKAGDAELERFRDTMFDADTRQMLDPWIRTFVGV